LAWKNNFGLAGWVLLRYFNFLFVVFPMLTNWSGPSFVGQLLKSLLGPTYVTIIFQFAFFFAKTQKDALIE
jgi:hypothetical protein